MRTFFADLSTKARFQFFLVLGKAAFFNGYPYFISIADHGVFTDISLLQHFNKGRLVDLFHAWSKTTVPLKADQYGKDDRIDPVDTEFRTFLWCLPGFFPVLTVAK